MRLPALMGLSLIAASAPTSPWPVERFFALSPSDDGRTIKAAGLRAQVHWHRCGDERPVNEACSSSDSYVSVTVFPPAGEPVTIGGDAGASWSLGAGPLGDGEGLILVSEMGGSAGCAGIAFAIRTGSESSRAI